MRYQKNYLLRYNYIKSMILIKQETWCREPMKKSAIERIIMIIPQSRGGAILVTLCLSTTHVCLIFPSYNLQVMAYWYETPSFNMLFIHVPYHVTHFQFFERSTSSLSKTCNFKNVMHIYIYIYQINVTFL